MAFRRFQITAFVALLSAAVALAQAWKSKSPEKWTKKEAKKILYDSPWAQTVILPYHPYTAQGARPDQRIGTTIGRLPTPTDDPLNPRQDWALIVQWSSSKTVRRAEGVADPDGLYRHGDRDDRPLKMFRVTVLPASLTHLLPYWSESELARTAYLKFGDRGKEIAPTEVRVQRTFGNDRAEAYLFLFPTKDDDGEPLLSSGVKAIHFRCQLGPVAMRAKFEPAKMVAHDGPDI